MMVLFLNHSFRKRVGSGLLLVRGKAYIAPLRTAWRGRPMERPRRGAFFRRREKFEVEGDIGFIDRLLSLALDSRDRFVDGARGALYYATGGNVCFFKHEDRGIEFIATPIYHEGLKKVVYYVARNYKGEPNIWDLRLVTSGELYREAEKACERAAKDFGVKPWAKVV